MFQLERGGFTEEGKVTWEEKEQFLKINLDCNIWANIIF